MKGKIFFVFFLFLFASCQKGENEDDSILKFFSKAYEDTGYSIAIGEDGYYICGQMTDTLSGNPVRKPGILKTGFDGNMSGEIKTFGSTEGAASKIITLSDGSVIAIGYVLDAASQKDIIVIHLKADLSLIDSRVYASAGNQYGVDILETQEGFLLLATTDVKREPVGEVTGNAAGKKDIQLMRIGKDLAPLTEIPAVGFIGNDEGVAVKADLNGGFTVVGTTDRSDRPASEQAGNNIILVRLNSVGSTTQPRILGGTKNEAASDFEVLNDGYLIVGTTGNAGTDQQGYIWKMPQDIYSTPEYEYEININSGSATKIPYSVKAMCRYKSSSFLLAGQYNTGLSARQLIFSIDAYGSLVENRIKITGGTGIQTVNDVVTDQSGNIISIGSNSYENNSMICFLKFRF